MFGAPHYSSLQRFSIHLRKRFDKFIHVSRRYFGAPPALYRPHEPSIKEPCAALWAPEDGVRRDASLLDGSQLRQRVNLLRRQILHKKRQQINLHLALSPLMVRAAHLQMLCAKNVLSSRKTRVEALCRRVLHGGYQTAHTHSSPRSAFREP